MKKKILVIITMTFFSVILNAQETEEFKRKVSFAVTAGYLNFTMSQKPDAAPSIKLFSENSFFVGINTDFTLSKKIHIQPSVLYSTGDRFEFLHIPVMFKYYVKPSFNLQLGPQLSYDLDKLHAKGVGLDLGAGFGYDLSKHFFVEGRYNYELTNRSELENLTVKNNTFTLGIGYKF